MRLKKAGEFFASAHTISDDTDGDFLIES